MTAEPANHQYDTHDFFDALNGGQPAGGQLPQGARPSRTATPVTPNPVDEQNFVISVVNALQASAGVELDGGRRRLRRLGRLVRPPGAADREPLVQRADALTTRLNGGAASATAARSRAARRRRRRCSGGAGDGGAPVAVQGRCGYGTRVPLLVISPFAKKNFVDHTLTDQTSILRFVEDNWLGGQRIQAGGSFDTIAGSIQNMFTGSERIDEPAERRPRVSARPPQLFSPA